MKRGRGAVFILTGVILGFGFSEILVVSASEEARDMVKTQEAAEEADEPQAMAESLLEQYDLGEMEEELDRLFPEEKPDFKETLLDIMSGDLTVTTELLKELAGKQLTYAFQSSRKTLIHILILAVVAAVFTQFGGVFQNRHISEVSFYMVYLLMIALCLDSFRAVIDWASGGIESLTSFMGVFYPVFFLSVTIAKGSVSAAAFYHLVLLLIYLVELFITGVILPLIHVYMMVKILNFLSMEDYLSKFAELIELFVSWSLKTLVAVTAGLGVVQSLISPAIDTVKRSVITRSAEAVPGVGDAIGGVTEVVLGTAVLVKNAIGMTGAVICFAICLLPLVQTGGVVLMYKLAAAVLQPVSDKRITGCIESVGEGCRLLMRVIFTTGLLFLLTIVIAAAATRGT